MAPKRKRKAQKKAPPEKKSTDFYESIKDLAARQDRTTLYKAFGKRDGRSLPLNLQYINKRRFSLARHVTGVTMQQIADEMGLSKARLVQYLDMDKWPERHFATLEDMLDFPGDWFKNPNPPKIRMDV